MKKNIGSNPASLSSREGAYAPNLRKKGNPISKRIIIGITGASGAIYGIRTLELLRACQGTETHLIITQAGKRSIEIETDRCAEEVSALADAVYDDGNVAAAPASGSFLTHGMVVVPCTIKTLSAIAGSHTGTLLARAADVTLKEKRKLALVVRETPLHKGHLRQMMRAADTGAMILPPMPAFYHRPKTVDDIVCQTVGKIFDFLGLEHDLFPRWGDSEEHVNLQQRKEV